MKSFLLTLLLSFVAAAYAAAPQSGLPKALARCPFTTTKTVLVHYQGKDVPDSDVPSKFTTPALPTYQDEAINAADGVFSILRAPDGSFSLRLTEIQDICGDTQRYHAVFRAANGKERPLNGKHNCGGNGLIAISPDSKYILLSGLRYVDVKTWTVCPLLGEPDYGYQSIQGWSRDGAKILIRDYDNWENPDAADEYMITIKK